ncbi:MAG: zinc ribbon domain-containing protein [Chloroflexi bacterium]|nr:MAG: zinc ribbon domain-containing protein [Chloroflexota bacterium]TME42968.1 MAG: zinc ribbon domain-containing protein [Chloroflexota bacterium]TME52541.1 MAG: zinc ribbon domain-containing protein [Chloroflexota bacterium]
MRSIGITLIIVFVPIYEYRCEECGKRSTALLSSYSSPDPACPHCGKHSLRRLVSSFATISSGESESDGGDDDFGGDDTFGRGDDDFGSGDDDF